MADSLPSALTALTTANTDHAADLALVYDASASELKKQTVREIKNEQGTAGADSSVVQKPHTNYADATVDCAVIAGGGGADESSRTVETGTSTRNEIGAHASYVAGTASYSTISGGYDHRNDQLAGTIAGGGHNLLNYQGDHGTIGGGSQNYVQNASDYATIGGGTYNGIGETAAALAATIAGGYNNTATQGPDHAIGGGRANDITSSSVAGGSTISGGNTNVIAGSGAYHTIAGGQNNQITSTGNGAAIFGGTGNTASGAYSVCGGQNNTVSGQNATALGQSNVNATPYSLALGLEVSPPADCDGALVFSGAGNPWAGSAGAAQAVSFVQSGQSTTNSAVNLTNRSTTVPTVAINSVLAGRVMVACRRTTSTSGGYWTCEFILNRGASGTINVVSQTWTEVNNGIATATPPTIRTGVVTFQIQITGIESVTVKWVARVDAVMAVVA